jgi:hypothetical protein
MQKSYIILDAMSTGNIPEIRGYLNYFIMQTYLSKRPIITLSMNLFPWISTVIDMS